MESNPPEKSGLAAARSKMFRAMELPEIDDVPIREILFSGFSKSTDDVPVEQVFIAGTARTTPPLHEVGGSWPKPRVYWRVLLGALLIYLLLRLGVTRYGNPNFIPGTLVIGSFVVPFAVVIFFFEMNSPRNVSIYQVCKMLLFGGALGLLATLAIGEVIPGAGVGELVPALLTGVVEETGKTLALLLFAANLRYPWALNGLLFGAAAGAGFAGFESAGYAFHALFDDQQDVFASISLRAFLAPFGHVIWTAIIGAALWKVRGERPFRFGLLFHPVVLKRWAAAVILHGLWDADLLRTRLPIQQLVLGVIGWFIVFAVLKEGLSQVAAASKAAAPANGG